MPSPKQVRNIVLITTALVLILILNIVGLISVAVAQGYTPPDYPYWALSADEKG